MQTELCSSPFLLRVYRDHPSLRERALSPELPDGRTEDTLVERTLELCAISMSSVNYRISDTRGGKHTRTNGQVTLVGRAFLRDALLEGNR